MSKMREAETIEKREDCHIRSFAICKEGNSYYEKRGRSDRSAENSNYLPKVRKYRSLLVDATDTLSRRTTHAFLPLYKMQLQLAKLRMNV